MSTRSTEASSTPTAGSDGPPISRQENRMGGGGTALPPGKGGIHMKRTCCLLTAFPPAVLLSACQPRPRRTSSGIKATGHMNGYARRHREPMRRSPPRYWVHELSVRSCPASVRGVARFLPALSQPSRRTAARFLSAFAQSSRQAAVRFLFDFILISPRHEKVFEKMQNGCNFWAFRVSIYIGGL